MTVIKDAKNIYILGRIQNHNWTGWEKQVPP